MEPATIYSEMTLHVPTTEYRARTPDCTGGVTAAAHIAVLTCTLSVSVVRQAGSRAEVWLLDV